MRKTRRSAVAPFRAAMRRASVQSHPVVPKSLPDLPDGWTLDRDLPCGNCGYNLRGRREPTCPECGSTFAWQKLLCVACPRCEAGLSECSAAFCPGCGLELDWARMFSAATPRGRDHFEYAPPGPSSVLRTWLRSLKPTNFWSAYRMEDPSRVARLQRIRRAALWVGIGGLLTIPLTRFFHALSHVALNAGSFRTDASEFIASQALPIASQLLKICLYLSLLLLPYALIHFGLPRFTPTLARFRVRPDHFLRISAFSALGVLLLGVLLGGFQIAAELAALHLGLGANPVKDRTTGDLLINPVAQLYRRILSDGRLSQAALMQWVGAIGFCGRVLIGMLVVILLWQWHFCLAALRSYLRLGLRSAVGLTLSVAAVALIAAPALYLVIQVMLWDLPRLP